MEMLCSFCQTKGCWNLSLVIHAVCGLLSSSRCLYLHTLSLLVGGHKWPFDFLAPHPIAERGDLKTWYALQYSQQRHIATTYRADVITLCVCWAAFPRYCLEPFTVVPQHWRLLCLGWVLVITWSEECALPFWLSSHVSIETGVPQC